MFSGGRLCEGLITRPEESYRLWRVVVCDLETSLYFISVLDRGEWSDWRPDGYPKGLPKGRYWPLGTRVYDCSCRNSNVEFLSAYYRFGTIQNRI